VFRREVEIGGRGVPIGYYGRYGMKLPRNEGRKASRQAGRGK